METTFIDTLPAGLVSVALSAAARVANAADPPSLPGHDCATKVVRTVARQVPFVWSGKLRVEFDLDPSPTGGYPRCLPERLAERLGWLKFAGVNTTEYARTRPGPWGYWWALTWPGLVALAGSENYRPVALRLHGETLLKCREWLQWQDSPGGFPSSSHTAQTLNRLDEVILAAARR